MPPNVTVEPGVKSVPRMVTESPPATAPVAGDTAVTVASGNIASSSDFLMRASLGKRSSRFPSG